MRFMWVVCAGMFVLGLDAYVTAGVVVPVAEGIGWGVASTGQMMTVYAAAYALVAPWLVTATWRGGRPTVVLGLAAVTLGSVVTAAAPAGWAVLLGRGLCGVGAGVVIPLATTFASALDVERRSRALAMVLGGLSGGATIGAPLSLLLMGVGGWRSVYLLLAALGLAVLVGSLLVPAFPVGRPPTPAARAGVLVRDPRLLLLVAVSFLQGAASLGVFTYLMPVLAASGAGVGPIPAVLIWAVGGVLGTVLVGSLAFVGRRPTAVASATLLVLAMALVALPVLGMPWLLVALALWGAAGWAFVIPQQYRLLAARPADGGPEHGGAVYGANSSVTYLGTASGAAAGGALLAGGTTATALPWLAGGLLVVALAVLSVGAAASRMAAAPVPAAAGDRR